MVRCVALVAAAAAAGGGGGGGGGGSYSPACNTLSGLETLLCRQQNKEVRARLLHVYDFG